MSIEQSSFLDTLLLIGWYSDIRHDSWENPRTLFRRHLLSTKLLIAILTCQVQNSSTFDHLMNMVLAVMRLMWVIYKHWRFSTLENLRWIIIHISKSVHSDKVIFIGLEMRRYLRLCSIVGCHLFQKVVTLEGSILSFTLSSMSSIFMRVRFTSIISRSRWHCSMFENIQVLITRCFLYSWSSLTMLSLPVWRLVRSSQLISSVYIT